MFAQGFLQMAVGLLYLASVSTALPGGELFDRQAFRCNADNCLRAVRGTPSAGSSACNSFFSTTVTQCATTSAVVTTTLTAPTTTVVVNSGTTTVVARTTSTTVLIRKRQNAGCTPTTVRPASTFPAFAAPCRFDASRFSSACRCIGISTGGTTTVTGTNTIGSTVTVTTTPVVTSTSQVVVVTTGTTTVVVTSTSSRTTSSTSSTPSVAGFKLVVSGGRQLRTLTDGSGRIAPIRGPGNGNIYTLDTSGQVSHQGASANRWLLKTTSGDDQIFDLVPSNGNYIVRCSVPPSGLGPFTCKGPGSSQIYFNICGQDGSDFQYLYLTSNYYKPGCAATDLQAVSPLNNP